MSEPAAVVETHTAVVVFVGGRAYKLKKPVDLGFVDFSTVAARAAACRREVELNRRLAPDVYLGVADVVGPDGAVCDHLVVMRRMPADRAETPLRDGAAEYAEQVFDEALTCWKHVDIIAGVIRAIVGDTRFDAAWST